LELNRMWGLKIVQHAVASTQSPVTDVASVLHAIEMDALQGLVGHVLGGTQVVPKGRDTQNPPP
jgi:hypothetical protein